MKKTLFVLCILALVGCKQDTPSLQAQHDALKTTVATQQTAIIELKTTVATQGNIIDDLQSAVTAHTIAIESYK